MAQRKKKTKKQTNQSSIGLTPKEVSSTKGQTQKLRNLISDIEEDGGQVLCSYKEPLGGHWVLLTSLPLKQVEPTPYQRKLSSPHVKNLANVIEKIDRFLDPVIAIRVGPKSYQVPNGYHRLGALKQLGAKTVTALVMVDEEMARMILALNVEKSHNLREKSHEVISLAEHLVGEGNYKETDLTLEFESPVFLTLGLCYRENGRFSGSIYQPFLKRIDKFQRKLLDRSIEQRIIWASMLLEVDERVSEIVIELKKRGFESQFLKNFVFSRINPLRFNLKRNHGLIMETGLKKLLENISKFNLEKVSKSDFLKAG
ncbi:MAG: chromosome partitioning protein ParB [Halobacteriovoraceae bacterium]|nr:chromosome partitioning protein ParB [Halobacteriovoraceae bacterium]